MSEKTLPIIFNTSSKMSNLTETKTTVIYMIPKFKKFHGQLKKNIFWDNCGDIFIWKGAILTNLNHRIWLDKSWHFGLTKRIFIDIMTWVFIYWILGQISSRLVLISQLFRTKNSETRSRKNLKYRSAHQIKMWNRV